MGTYDAIVVGAGNGGLSCATTLAQAGRKVLLIEQNDYPGGCATSFRLGRYEFEASLHELCDVGSRDSPGEVRKMFDNFQIKEKWLDVGDSLRVISESASRERVDFRFVKGRRRFVEQLERYVPHSQKPMGAFFDLVDETNAAMAYFSLSQGRVDFSLMKNKYARFLWASSCSFNEVLRALAVPSKAIEILDSYWPYLGVDAEEGNFQQFALMVSSFIDQGASLPEKTSSHLSLSLLDAFRRFGGEVRFSCRALRFLFDEKKHISGVMTTQGNFFSSHTIFNGSPSLAYARMIRGDVIPDREIRLCNARKFSGRMVCVYLGLMRSPEQLGLLDYTIFMPETLDATREKKASGSFKTLHGIMALCLNVISPARSPKGTTLLTLTQMLDRDVWGDIPYSEYFHKKSEVAEKMIKVFEEKTQIRIRPYIEEISIATPWTFARYCATPEGAAYGYENTNWDSTMLRMLSFPNDQPIQGLHFVGASSFRGCGFSAAYLSGLTVGRAVLQDLREGK
jgi:phytoene dehydrogenase-like protein